jgi:hypothetical protein
MKIFTLFLLFGAASVQAQTTDSVSRVIDMPTRVVVIRPNEVEITSSEEMLDVIVRGAEGNPGYELKRHYEFKRGGTYVEREENSALNFVLPFSRVSQRSARNYQPQHSYTDLTAGSFRLGVVSALRAPEGMNVKVAKSFELAFAPIQFKHRFAHSDWGLRTGLWLNWRNYRMTDEVRFLRGEDGNIELGAYPEGARPRFSRIKIYSLEFPIHLLAYTRNQDWTFAFGPTVSYNSRASIKTRYRDADDQKQKDYRRGIHVNRLTVDLYGQVSYEGVGLYVKYSPCNVLESHYAPEFGGISMGLILGL